MKRKGKVHQGKGEDAVRQVVVLSRVVVHALLRR
jgi:hypothetical protein